MRMAYRLHRLPAPGLSTEDAPALRSAEVLEMATSSGARAVGLGHEIGELLPGRQADAVLLRRQAIDGAYVHLPPLPSTHASCAAADVPSTPCWSSATVVVDAGRCVGLDEDALAAELRSAVRLDDRSCSGS
jgi:hypothetical protein